MAKFTSKRTKYVPVMLKKDNVKLVQHKLQWSLKKHFLGIRFTDLYHLSSDVARYEKVRAVKASVRTGVHKRLHY